MDRNFFVIVPALLFVFCLGFWVFSYATFGLACLLALWWIGSWVAAFCRWLYVKGYWD